MSITEAAAIKAVEDGLAGRNVPIVHEEIRVVLAMALRAETAERDLDTARGLIARLGDADALESLNALLTLERANHLSARARVVELERERDEAADEAAACLEFLRTLRDWHSFWEEGFLGEKTASASRQNGQALRAFLDETGHARRVVERLASLERDLAEARLRVCTTAIGCGECERCRAVASAARLREALEALVEYERKRHPPKMGGDHLPPTLREVMDIARAALASAPSAEPTPRDMRIALESEVEGMRQRARAAEAQRDEAVSLAHESLTESVRVKADAARLREALERELPDEARPYSLESADAAHYAREVSRCARVNEQRNRILAALASAPSAEPTPRDMRIAEAWEAFQPHLDAAEEALARGIQWDGDTMQVLYEARAVVAKAVGT